MKVLYIISLLILASCSHSVHLVNMSDRSLIVDQSKGNEIEAESIQHVIFWIASDTDYVQRAHQELINKCPNGDIKNITTRYSTSHGFFNWYNKIYMQARCFR